MEKTLHLNLKKEWFDMILSGEKKEEYRDIKTYYTNRLVNKPFSQMSGDDIDLLQKDLEACPNGFWRDYKVISFKNGYGKNAPEMKVEFKGIEIAEGNTDWGADLYQWYFSIKLGKILETNNIKQS